MADNSKKYNTKLNDADEAKFSKWAIDNKRENDSYDYDIHGAWKDMQKGNLKQAENGHLPDTYKKPNHPTFSEQSKYHGTDGAIGGKWIDDGKGKYTFKASVTNLKNMNKEQLQNYFNEVEKGNSLDTKDAEEQLAYEAEMKNK